MTVPDRMRDAVDRARFEVSDLHAELPRWGLVAWTAGNVSTRVASDDGRSDLLVIKPSGITYDDLRPERMVVCDLDGRLVDGDLQPYSDTAAHAYVYRHMRHVGGVVHTHSPYATAWAARGEAATALGVPVTLSTATASIASLICVRAASKPLALLSRVPRARRLASVSLSAPESTTGVGALSVQQAVTLVERPDRLLRGIRAFSPCETTHRSRQHRSAIVASIAMNRSPSTRRSSHEGSPRA